MDYDPQSLPAGKEIAGYRIVRKLGAGGFGITYEAHNEVTKRRVAIKEFFPRGIASRESATRLLYSRADAEIVGWALDRFQRSTSDLCELRHPTRSGIRSRPRPQWRQLAGRPLIAPP